MLNEIKKGVVGFVQGLVEAAGTASPPVELVPHPDGNRRVALVREGYAVQVLDGRKQNRRGHTFTDLASFAAWLNRHASPPMAEILVGESAVRAALDPIDPNGDVVTCDLVQHPAFVAWAGILGRWMGQREIYGFARGHLGDFEEAHANNGTSLGTYGEIFVAELQKFEAVRDGRIETQIDARGTTVFQGSTEKLTINGKLPPGFTVHVPIFDGVQVQVPDGGEPTGSRWTEATYALNLLLQIEFTEDKRPRFALVCPDLDVVKREAARDAVAWLTHCLADGFLVSLGALALAPAPRVEA